MNRIYQGRVIKAELPDGNGGWKEFDENPKIAKEKWQAALWQHHELFQDAVNYYTVALAAMAGGVEGESAQAKALRSWVGKVRETWTVARRKAQKFDCPQSRLALILNLDPDKADFSGAADYVLRTSCATPRQRAAAVMQLLATKGDLNQVCVDRLPWLATAAGKLKATSKAVTSSQEAKRQQAVRQFHQWPDQKALREALNLDLGLFQTQPSGKSVEGIEAARMLCGYFAKVSVKFPGLDPIAKYFEKCVTGQGDVLKVPLPGRKPSGLYPVAAVFKYFPVSESLAAFREATKTLANARDREVITDALADARVDDQQHFDYFTNVALGDRYNGEEHDTRAIWFEFDLAAFIEAIKAPRRYFEDTQKREEAADRLRNKITAMEGKGYEPSGAYDEDESLPGFEGDARIGLLKTIVQQDLAWLAETEGDADPGALTEYTIRERTVRGLGEIKRRWKGVYDAGRATEESLLAIAAEVQTEHREDIGSAALCHALAKSEYHPIWRDRGSQPWHAEDPLSAWLTYKELQADLLDKERPIRFTPAHATYSPRYYNLPKQGRFGSEHAPGQLSFTAGIALKTQRGFVPTTVRIHYAAPRLCRDQIRTKGDAALEETPWLQPMMMGLGLDKQPDHVNFANCSITLQPASESDIQLTFPVEVNTENIRSCVARQALWSRQFNLYPEGRTFFNASLRWPHEKQPAKAPVPWHEQVSSFRCIATDLGQRDAGAYARLFLQSNGDCDGRPSRFIGATGDKQWHATLEKAGLFRLPGEDGRVWREQSSLDKKNSHDSGKEFDYREELWGERGRPARHWEADETAELMGLLEASPESAELSLLTLDWRDALTFPEQNDKLLVAMRRYQSRISRLHRWCWFLKGDDKKQGTAWSELLDCDDSRLVTAEVRDLAERRDPRVSQVLAAQVVQRMEAAPKLLIRIANRILPLRGRSWQWEKHPDATADNMLHILTQKGRSLDKADRPVWLRGQRGLSFERIEQIEELRKRFQSLNQTLRREVGGRPSARRDETIADPCPDLLDKLEHIKEQRTNQTAHLILAEALGLRLAPPPFDKKTLRQEKDQHGVYEKVKDKNGEWIGPADFIIIEDLSRYRASQGRSPRENSRLMKWCHRAVRDKLKQLCEVYGLPVVETPAAYSSRFCARSGVPGFRATEVTAGFTKQGQWAWLVGKKDSKGKVTEEAQRLLDLDYTLVATQEHLERDWAEKKLSGQCPKRTLLVPMPGGPIFVPVVGSVETGDIQPAVVQADINAAINLALRAIADPWVWGIHPRLRSQREGGAGSKRKKGKTKKGVETPPPAARLLTREKRKYGEAGKLLVIHRPADAKPDDTKQPNFFADLAGLEALAAREHSWLLSEWTSAELVGESGQPPLLHGKTLWGCVNAMRWARVTAINQERLDKWRKKIR